MLTEVPFQACLMRGSVTYSVDTLYWFITHLLVNVPDLIFKWLEETRIC